MRYPNPSETLTICASAEPLLVTKADAARLLTVSPRHVDSLVSRGLLPKVKLGSACRFRIADIMGLVDRLAAGSPETRPNG